VLLAVAWTAGLVAVLAPLAVALPARIGQRAMIEALDAALAGPTLLEVARWPATGGPNELFGAKQRRSIGKRWETFRGAARIDRMMHRIGKRSRLLPRAGARPTGRREYR
jgi:hypothetical protein